MEFFAPIDPAEAPVEGPARLRHAWLLRQADMRRALALAEDAARGGDAPSRGRLALIRTEAAIQAGRWEEAARFAADAQAQLRADPVGRADAGLAAALLASARGQAAAALPIADGVARDEDAADRRQIAAAYAALTSVYADPASTERRLAALEEQALSPVAAVFVGVTRALRRFNAGDHLDVIRRMEPLVEQARTLGMLQLRLRMQNTVAAAYSNLDDKESAISWVEDSLAGARAADWPIATGEALAFLGNFYREAGHHERALETLAQARATLEVAPASRGFALACCYLAHAQLGAGRPREALESARVSEAAARAIQATPIVVDMLTVAARAHARLGLGAEAARLAAEALADAQRQQLGVWKVDALRALAEIHTRHALPPPQGVPADAAALHYLERARAEVEAQGGHAESVNILRELSQAHERCGDLAAALAAERAAFAQALSLDAKRLNNRMLAVEAQHQVDKQRLELAHQKHLAAEMERLANTDTLTGIPNRRSFLAHARAELERAHRHGRPLALIMCDIDHFKAVNDRWGHPCGDWVISAAAATLDGARRAVDLAGRLGGEEFGLLLPETDLGTAAAIAERLRERVEHSATEWEGERVPFTMSFGVASLDPAAGSAVDEASLERLVARADAALYAAKAGGRNRVRADPPATLLTA